LVTFASNNISYLTVWNCT